MNKAQQRQEMTTYTIWRTGGPNDHRFQINKLVIGVETGDSYWVELKPGKDPFCNCPGFIRQTYAKEKHKHVALARDYVSRGEPDKALYKIHGAGKDYQLEYMGEKAL